MEPKNDGMTLGQCPEGAWIGHIIARRPGWQRCFQHLVEAYGPYLHQRCMRQLESAADAEDAVQETFVSAYRFLDRFEGRSTLKTWLTRIADNHCVQIHRRRRGFRDTGREEWREVLEAAQVDRHEVAQEDDANELVSDLMGRLSPSAREALALRYWGELSFEQMARVLGVGLSASKMRVRRALQAARDQLAEDAPSIRSAANPQGGRSAAGRLCA